jgi:hypothetical protein
MRRTRRNQGGEADDVTNINMPKKQFAFCFLCLGNFVSRIKARTHTKDVCKQSAEDNIFKQDGVIKKDI